MHRALVVFVLLVAQACDTSSSALGPQRVDSAGVEIVHLPAPDWSQTSTLRETLKVGAADAEGPFQFYQILAMALGGDGSFYVGDRQSATVRHFDAEGRFLGQFGGRGQGPGEFTMVNGLWTIGDSVVVTDWQRGGRVGLFGSDGELLENHVFQMGSRQRLMPMWLDEEGWVGFAEGPTIPSAEGRDSVAMHRPLRRLFLEDDSAGAVVHDLPPEILYPSTTTHGLDWGLFRALPRYGFDERGRFHLTRPTVHHVELYDSDDTLVRSVRTAVDLVPVTQADVDLVLELALALTDTVSLIPDASRPEQRRRTRERFEEQASYPVPEHRAPLGELLVAKDGSYWVERIDHRSPAHAYVQGMWGTFGTVSPVSTRWEVVDPDGRRVHLVELPARFRPYAVERSSVIGVWFDDFDVEHVVRYEIQPVGERSPTP